MATAAQGFISAALPAKIVRTSGTTLFHVAARWLGDPLLWTALATQNEIVDPWLLGNAEIAIPPVVNRQVPTGILAPTWPSSAAIVTQPPAVPVPAPPPAPPPAFGYGWALDLPMSPPADGGLLWLNGGVVMVTPGFSPGALSWVLALPISAPSTPPGAFWINGGVLMVTAGSGLPLYPAGSGSLWDNGGFVEVAS